MDWELAHLDNLLTALSSSISDHSPLLMVSFCTIASKRRFQFEAFWPKLPGFKVEVERIWALFGWAANPHATLDQKLWGHYGGAAFLGQACGWEYQTATPDGP
jgi:hypothetical protein